MKRPIGILAIHIARVSSGDLPESRANLRMLSSTMSVSTNPGQIALTVTPNGAASNATSLVRPSTACFEDTYAARLGRSAPCSMSRRC